MVVDVPVAVHVMMWSEVVDMHVVVQRQVPQSMQ